MGNSLRDMFDPNSEYNKRLRKKLKDIEREMIENHDCSFCKNAIHPPHFEMGKYGGCDTYCRIMKEYKHYGDTCIFYDFNEFYKEKNMDSVNCVGCDWYDHEYNFCSYLTCDGTNCDEKLPCEKEDENDG